MGCPDPVHHADPDHQSIKHLPIKHVSQRHSWDCGIACALMVLQSFGIESCHSELIQECGTKSVWTVDLAHLLSNHGCLVSFLTITVGTNPEYASERFYARNIHSDKFRVERLFQQAQQAGIPISVRSVEWQELRDWLIGEVCLIIVLVDKCKLRHSLEDAGRLAPPACCCGLVRFSYRGHYIVLTGFDDSRGVFKMEDPSSPCSSSISPSDLDAARLAFGTDEDLLVVSRCRGPGALHNGGGGAGPINKHSQAKFLALLGQGSYLRPTQNGSDQGLSEAKPANDILHAHRTVQMSNRGTDSNSTSEEREALVPRSSIATRNSSSLAGPV